MELRRFGREKARTWYQEQPFRLRDVGVVMGAIVVVAIGVLLLFVDHGRVYNPFRPAG